MEKLLTILFLAVFVGCSGSIKEKEVPLNSGPRKLAEFNGETLWGPFENLRLNKKPEGINENEDELFWMVTSLIQDNVAMLMRTPAAGELFTNFSEEHYRKWLFENARGEHDDELSDDEDVVFNVKFSENATTQLTLEPLCQKPEEPTFEELKDPDVEAKWTAEVLFCMDIILKAPDACCYWIEKPIMESDRKGSVVLAQYRKSEDGKDAIPINTLRLHYIKVTKISDYDENSYDQWLFDGREFLK